MFKNNLQHFSPLTNNYNLNPTSRPSSLSERRLLEGDKGRQNENFNKNVPQTGASEPNCSPPQSPFRVEYLPVWVETHGEAVSSF